MKRLITFIFVLFIVFVLNAQRLVRVGLFQEKLLNSFVFHCLSGEYNIIHDSGRFIFKEGELLYFSLVDNNILASDGEMNFGHYSNIHLQDASGKGIFRIKPVDPAGETRIYEGDLEVSVHHESILLVNVIDLNKYLSGVVEAEGGPSAHLEYYKAQAVLCRTYAIKNFHAHVGEGFNLCDHTHCQAYKGMSDQNPDIQEAVLSTHNILITGRFIKLVDAVYHANSGGETQRASDIWPSGAEYLQSVLDPFSLNQPGSKWERTIPADMWRNYLISHNIKASSTGEMKDLLITQPHRRRFFIMQKDSLRIERIRADFNLRSAFFDMEIRGENVVFKGKGYGHGVGMSQEGAMNMAKQGFSFSDILRFYYHQVQIRDILDIPDENLPKDFRIIL